MRKEEVWFAGFLMLSGAVCSLHSADLSIVVHQDKNPMEVTLENSKIRVVYGPIYFHGDEHEPEGDIQTAIREFTIKQHNQDLLVYENKKRNRHFDRQFKRNHLSEAKIIRDGDNEKTIYMKWKGLRTPEEEVTIYRDQPFIKIRYIAYAYWMNDAVDWRSLGWGDGELKVYGVENWERGYALGIKPMFYSTQDNGDPADGGPLNYQGWFVMAAYIKKTGLGFGRVAPVKEIRRIFLFNYHSTTKWGSKIGWELKPLNDRPVFDTYLYAVTGGGDAAMATGKTVADFANGHGIPEPVAILSITPGGGSFADSVLTKITADTLGIVIHYTLDGTAPNRLSPKYIGPLIIKKSCTLKARGYTAEYADSSEVASVTYTITPTLLPVNPVGDTPGLLYKYFEGTWTTLPDFSTLTPKATGSVAQFLLSPKQRDDNFSFVFEGYIQTTKPGLHWFYLDSDAGSRLYLGEHLIVDNDGLGITKDSGAVNLQTGKYFIRVDYYDDTEFELLTVRYKAPEEYRVVVPASVLSHGGTRVLPGAALDRIPANKKSGVYAYRLNGSRIGAIPRGRVRTRASAVTIGSGLYIVGTRQENRQAARRMLLVR